MDNTIIFSNPGEIDPLSISTMGANVKETVNPIGFFGTGLKYAIAVLLRQQQEITIWSGEREFELFTTSEFIRGKEFQIVNMRHDGSVERLGFTTELGKQWTLQNAYRELYCNAKDEGGGEGNGVPSAGQTVVIIRGGEFAAVHRQRREFIIEPDGGRRLIFSIPGQGEIYEGSSTQLFYKNIAVGKPIGGGYKYTYNIQSNLELTEDRTFKEDYASRAKVCKLLAACTDREVLRHSLQAADTGGERHLYFSWESCGEQFYETVADLLRAGGEESVLQEVKSAFYKAKGVPKLVRRTLEPTDEDRKMLREGVEFWQRVGIDIPEFPIKLVHSLSSTPGVRVYAQAEDGAIWLTPECFSSERLLRLALVEEWIHLKHRVGDETRDMQNVLFQYMVELTERLREPTYQMQIQHKEEEMPF